MLGRQVSNSLLRLPTYARLPLRPSPFQCQHDLLPRALFCSSQRFYATPGRPRKAVGEPSKPVRRAVKRSAKSASTADSPAKRKNVEAKKTAAAKKKKEKKPLGRKSKLTPEQQAVKKSKAELKDLKKAALSPPTKATMTAWLMYMKENLKSGGQSGVREQSHDLAQQYRNLSPAELEHYNHLAHTATEANLAEYKRWVESHTVEQIHIANLARLNLKRRLKIQRSTKYSPIRDERAVKRVRGPYIQFTINRHHSGDFKNIPLVERSKLIGKEWRALSESEKSKYKELSSEDLSRYTTEYNDVHGHMPAFMTNGQAQAAAAAA